MFPYQIDTKKAAKKWQSVVETFGLNTQHPVGAQKLEWMAEYAEMHQMKEALSKGKINENVAYANMGTITGMGPVVSPQPGTTPGATGTTGSGDIGQNLLPIAMKIAYQTIGLDLISVKPSAGPKIDLLYMDYRYDDASLDGSKEKPQLFQVPVHATLKAHLQRILTENVNPSGRMFVAIEVASTPSGVVHPIDQEGGVGGVKSYYMPTFEGQAKTALTLDSTALASGTTFYLEFIGFSTYTGNAIFRAYRQTNTASTGVWEFDYTLNSFPAKMSIATALGVNATGAVNNAAYLSASFAAGTGSTPTPMIEGADGAAFPAGNYYNSIDLVSTLEDHVPGFSANWNKTTSMTRAEDEDFNPGVIGTNFFTKTVQTGVAEVSAAVKRNEIEDIKATTGIDIVAKLEGILVNELSQKISREIVSQVKELGLKNRTFAPRVTNPNVPAGWGSFETLFDFDVDKYAGGINITGTSNGVNPLVPVEMTASNYRTDSGSLQRKLISKIRNASAFILKEGRYGAANYIVTSGSIASIISDNSGWTASPYTSSIDTTKQLYPAGTMMGITVYVDPYQEFNDNTLYLGRKNPIDQPGLVFIPYLMAQSLSIISEATRAPRLFLRSRYAISAIGFYPEKQFMAIKVRDTYNLLA